ncbi:Vacuolar calcium ion transporter [Vanrija pseudolonga]|uniref:Vacuolar calcium ion transporter n=1 Tax=Vanrija pseudolonga TaxID=143232 RepID=A0AAF0YI02_9TREE|nr:Vacuolar calcium ion transporter [Vanrija pseudolonga]
MATPAPNAAATPPLVSTPGPASPRDSLNLAAMTSSDSSGPRKRPTRKVTLDLDANGGAGFERPTRTSTSRQSSRRRTDPDAGPLQRVTTALFTPDKPVGKSPGYVQSVKACLFSSWVNVLLVFIPIGWALHFVKHSNSKISDTAVFITNFIAIIPLAGLLGFTTEEVAMRLGQTLGGLLNATLGNAVELIVAILALIKCELTVVQSSLVGSILSNLLLVLGMCFFAGGIRFAEQSMKSTAAQLNSSLLLIAVLAVLVPSAFHFSVKVTPSGDGVALTSKEEAEDILSMSHGVAILLLLLYIGYLIFQMWTHANLYDDAEEVVPSTQYHESVSNAPGRVANKVRGIIHRKKTDEETLDSEGKSSAIAVNNTSNADPEAALPVTAEPEQEDDEEEEEEEEPQMNMITTIIAMVIITVIIGVTAEFLVSSINGLTEAHPSLSQEWVGLILLPIVGNAAEHFTAVSVAVKDKLDLSISVAVGSSIQIALFVIPVIQLLAWTLGKPLTLLFDPFESLVLFFSVIIVNQTLADGRSNWMEGVVLMFFYVLLAVAFWFYPGTDIALFTCT